MAKVMLVDDDLMFTLDLQHQVQRLGHEVVAMARNASEAREAFEQTHPDLVLMDIFLHGQTDGIETVHAMRGANNLPVIFMTAASDEKTLARAVQEGPSAYLLKPFGRSDLDKSMNLALHAASTEARKKAALQAKGAVQAAALELPINTGENPVLPLTAQQLAERRGLERKSQQAFEIFSHLRE